MRERRWADTLSAEGKKAPSFPPWCTTRPSRDWFPVMKARSAGGGGAPLVSSF